MTLRLDRRGQDPATSEEYARAILNILEDFMVEKGRLEESQKAMLNLLEDFDAEKERLVGAQRASFNILEDFSGEKELLEASQRAMLNLLDDFNVERVTVESQHHELQKSFQSLHEAKDAADAYNREIESFSYSVSHDLRTPLRGIAGFSQALLENYAGNLDDRGKGFLNRIIAAATKMGQLIDDLLNLSRVTRTEMKRERVDLSAAAGRIAQSLAESSPERQAEFRIEDGLFAEGDAPWLSVVLENLLGNAWKFTGKREHAMIEFGALPDGAETVYFVRDNGAGLDMAYSGKLFQPFQRAHKADDFQGTGIGLATVKRIIERHGGRVWMEGEAGKGATVYFTI
jgi:signal transduction histidine kinase